MIITQNGDDVMQDVDVIVSTEIDSTMPQTLNPAELVLSAQDEDLSSPELTRTAYSNGTHLPNAALSQVSSGDSALLSPHRKASTGAAKYAPLPYASARSGLVYDVRMRFHVEPIPRDTDMHPEDPRRIFEVYNELCQAGLVDDPTDPDAAGRYVLLRIPARSAIEQEILACHSQASFDFVMSLKSKSHRVSRAQSRNH